MIVVGSPDYLERHAAPVVPQDRTRHNCINLSLPTRGGLYAWEFEKDGEELRVRVDGQITCNGITQILNMAKDSFGLCFVTDGLAMPEVEAGRLVQVLGGWCPSYSGYHLYYPNRRSSSAAFNIVVEALRERR